jgi:hypothetical protein
MFIRQSTELTAWDGVYEHSYPKDFLFQAFEKAGIMLCCRSVGLVHTSYVALSTCPIRVNHLRRQL